MFGFPLRVSSHLKVNIVFRLRKDLRFVEDFHLGNVLCRIHTTRKETSPYDRLSHKSASTYFRPKIRILGYANEDENEMNSNDMLFVMQQRAHER